MRARATLVFQPSSVFYFGYIVKCVISKISNEIEGPTEGLLNIKFKSETAAIRKSSAWRYRLKAGTVSNHIIYYHLISTSPKRRT